MLEIPEAHTIATQIDKDLTGRTITSAVAGHSPHGFAWYSEDPAWYGQAMAGLVVEGARAWANYVEVSLGTLHLALSEGPNPRLLAPGVPRPDRHQLLVEFDDGSALVCRVQMYGCLMLFEDGECDNPYYLGARRAPDPLTGAFTVGHLQALADGAPKALSAKGLLATEQRIPGLGNGCLQDILLGAGIHPQRKVATLDPAEIAVLHRVVVETLRAMTDAGGRDTEKDLYGRPGGYRTILSAKTRDLPCPHCGGAITRKAYMGGNVYFCASCQPLS